MSAYAFRAQMSLYGDLVWRWEVRKVSRENGSYLSQNCTLVSCRVMWSTRSLCYSILNPCKVGTGIQKQKSVNCQHALQWTFCICSHRHVTSHNLTVHGWR